MADRKYARIVKYIEDFPFAMLPSALDAMLEVLHLRLEGRVLTEQEIKARTGVVTPPSKRTIGTVAVIPVFGVLAHRMNMMTDISGGTSTEQLASAFNAAVLDPAVTAILLDIDSPGGSVFGIQELADVIYRGRGSKPITAIANATAASAAYWIASSADEILVTPSGQVGSIGVVAVHQDRSKQAEMLGVQHTFITAGKYKASGNDLEPLDDATRADMQKRVDQYYGAFVRAVARGRGVKPEAVRDGFGEGRMVGSSEAVRLGMADGLGTLESTIGGLVSGQPRAMAQSPLEMLENGSLRLQDAPAPVKDDAKQPSEADELRRKLALRGA